ncbi:MAG: hypothetical protein JXA60_11250 [Candidatus Coatesbacteria bacterium]|nr:hypothetical protein [Candidatus Coatesbacteria bacterium]
MRLILVFLFGLSISLHSDTIFTMRGGKFEGSLVVIDKEVVVFKTAQGQKEFSREVVNSIMLNEPFHTPSTESKATSGTPKKEKPLVIMRDGTRIRANIIGASKKWIELETDYGKARYKRDEVMFVDTYNRSQLGFLDIDAKTPWIKTPLVLKYGDRIEIAAIGSIKTDPHADEEIVEPEGILDGVSRELPLPSSWHGALIGRIGEKGTPFLIGSYLKIIIMDKSQEGQLFVGINDYPEFMKDNIGFFRAHYFVW